MDLSIFDKDYRHQFVVSQAVYDSFQQCSGDKNPLHTNVKFACAKGFPEKVMYGNILNGFISYFVGMMLPNPDVIIHSQDILFKNPVFLNDVLDFSAKVDDISEVINTVIFKYVFKKTDGTIVARGHVQIGII
jgi:acyl dehydratase